MSFSHEGPVWQLSWAHPKFGNILASCSYDRKVSEQTFRFLEWTIINVRLLDYYASLIRLLFGRKLVATGQNFTNSANTNHPVRY